MLSKANLYIMVFCLLFPFFAYGEDSETHIKSDSGNFNYKTGIGTYIGHVVMTREPTKLEADKAITYFDKKRKLQKAFAFGNPAHLWQAATANQIEFHAYGKRIEYYPNQHLIILIGDGKIIHDNHVLQAPYITYNIQDQVLISKPSETQRTTIIIRKSE